MDELINVNNIEGSEFSDTLVGNDKDNKINGLDGNDFIRITLGKDEIDGGKGKNYINSFKYNDCRINADLTGEEYTTICEEDKDN